MLTSGNKVLQAIVHVDSRFSPSATGANLFKGLTPLGCINTRVPAEGVGDEAGHGKVECVVSPKKLNTHERAG